MGDNNTAFTRGKRWQLHRSAACLTFFVLLKPCSVRTTGRGGVQRWSVEQQRLRPFFHIFFTVCSSCFCCRCGLCGSAVSACMMAMLFAKVSADGFPGKRILGGIEVGWGCGVYERVYLSSKTSGTRADQWLERHKDEVHCVEEDEEEEEEENGCLLRSFWFAGKLYPSSRLSCRFSAGSLSLFGLCVSFNLYYVKSI